MDRQEMEKMHHNTQYCKELHQQLVNKLEREQCQYEDTLIEKKMLEEVMKTNADEDQRELEKNRRETEEQWHEMVTSSQAHTAWKDKKEQMIGEQRQFADDRSFAVTEDMERKMRAKEEFNDRFPCKMLSDEAACLKRENIIGLVKEQEYQDKHAQDDIAEREYSVRAKKEMREDLCNQMDSKKQEAHKQREWDADFMKEVEENCANRIILKALYTDKEDMDREEMEKMHHNNQYCKELHQQLVNKLEQEQCQYEDTLTEKKMLEEVMRTNADEEQRELEKNRRETEEQWHEMVTSSQAHAAWKDKKEQMIEDRSFAVAEDMERKMRAKEEFNDRFPCKMLSDEAACLDRDNIIGLVKEQEYQNKHAQDDIAEIDNSERAKKEMREDLNNQMESKKQEAQAQREVDADFMKETEERMVVEDQIEHEKAMKIKEKNRQYGIDLRQQIADNTCRRENEKKKEKAFEQAMSHYDENWRLEVRLEHDRVVSAHGARVPECHSDVPYPRDGAASDAAP